MLSLPPIKSWVFASLELIERAFTPQDDEAALQPLKLAYDWSFKYELAGSTFRRQARLVRLTAVERKMPVLWLTRNHSALDTLTNFLCDYAGVDACHIASGNMLESDFPKLTGACGVVAASKLSLCDVVSTEQFEQIVLDLANGSEFSYVLCDWNLNKMEESFANGLAQKIDIAVFWPD